MTRDYHQFTDNGIQVIAIVNDSPEKARAYFQKHTIPFPCLTDPEHRVYDRYQVESKAFSLGQRPGLFIIDREGTTRYAYIGSQQWQIPGNAEVLDVCRRLPCLDEE